MHVQDPAAVSRRYSRFEQRYLPRKRRKIIYTMSSVAAVLLLIIGIYIFLPSDKPHLVVSTLDHKKEVKLPDGSVIWLNKNSKVTYPEDFTSHRAVQLTGEAYFDVVHNPRKPFTVKTAGLFIEVLGTQFVVTDYEEENAAEAVLKAGKVQVETPQTGESYLLHPGQMVTYDKELSTTRLETVDSQNFTNWVNNSLNFKNTSLKDAFIQLEKWYGIRIECKDTHLLQTPVSFSVDTESQEEILDILTLIAPFTWKHADHEEGKTPTIIISGK